MSHPHHWFWPIQSNQSPTNFNDIYSTTGPALVLSCPVHAAQVTVAVLPHSPESPRLHFFLSTPSELAYLSLPRCSSPLPLNLFGGGGAVLAAACLKMLAEAGVGTSSRLVAASGAPSLPSSCHLPGLRHSSAWCGVSTLSRELLQSPMAGGRWRCTT